MSNGITEVVEFTIYGTPRPQGSMALFRAKSGHEVAKYSNTTYEWRNMVTTACQAAYPEGLAFPTEAVRMSIVFDLERPQAHWGTGRNSGKLKPSAPAWPGKMPDLDKLVRAIGDAITDAGTVWRDDGQVVALIAEKRYAELDEVPGATVRIDAIEVV